jgi:hypothetical protein
MTSETSSRTRITILVSGEIHDVPARKIFRLLRKSGLKITEVLAERISDD